MELKVSEIAIPERIEFNFEELKAEITEKVNFYKTMVYTEDQIKEAKADKANLNKLKKAFNDERIRLEREYLAPFNAFKSQVSEITAIFDEAIGTIDSQIKDYDQAKKAAKLEEIKEMWDGIEIKASWLTLEMIYQPTWLNATVSLKNIKAEMQESINRVNNDLDTLAKLPEFSFEATEEYKATLDINRAISEGQRLADIQKRKAEMLKAVEEAKAKEAEEKAKAEAEAVKEEPKAEEPAKAETTVEQIYTVAFKCELTMVQAVALKEFFIANGIKFEKLVKE